MQLYMEKPGWETVQTHSCKSKTVQGIRPISFCSLRLYSLYSDNCGDRDGDCSTAVQYLHDVSILVSNLSNFSTDKSVSVRLVIVKLLHEHSMIVNTEFSNNSS